MSEIRYFHQLLDKSAARHPRQVALREEARCLTWAEYRDLSLRIAECYRAAGIKPGERVVLLGENCISLAAAIFAGSRAGVITVSLNARMSAQELDRVLVHCDPAAILFTSGISPAARDHAARMKASDLGVADCGLEILRLAPTIQPTLAEKDVAVILYTTGTTGDPKGVMLTHSNVIYSATSSGGLRKMTPGDQVYCVLPISHVFGLCSVLVACAARGSTAVMRPRFSAPSLLAAIREGLTILPGVPQMHVQLIAHLQDLGLRKLGSPTLRYITSGGAPLDPAWKRQVEGFYDLPLYNGYGLTETTSGATLTAAVKDVPDTSVGVPFPNVEIRIDSPDTASGVGEILIRGANVMLGYFRNPAATAAAIDAEGWLRSGDLGYLDDQGRLYVKGRSKELIIRGGFNIYPPEVEAAITQHPDILQCAVVGRRRDGDEQVLAFAVPRQGASVTEEDLMKFASSRLTGYKRPSQIIFCQTLPISASGKVLKHMLTGVFSDRLN